MFNIAERRTVVQGAAANSGLGSLCLTRNWLHRTYFLLALAASLVGSVPSAASFARQRDYSDRALVWFEDRDGKQMHY